MVNTTTEYKRALYTNPRFYGKAAIKLGSGQTINIQDTAQSTVFLPDGLKVDDSVSSSGNFDIGSAIINRLVMRLDNTAEAFSKYDFTGAVITAYVGLQLDGRIEWVKKGVFNAEDPKAIASILSIEAMDNMTKFDKEYDRKITFPATLQTIIMHCCDRCGVPLVNSRFDNYNYVVKTNPFEENSSSLTYRQLLSYCAQIAGCFARCNADGHLELKWYDTSVFEGGSNMDGGTFDSGSPYATGDGLDGGNFINYASGDDFDGGTFLEQRDYHHIFALQSIEVSTDDIVVTAIRVTANSGKDDKDQTVDGETAQCGQDGYVLSISKNPLIECGRAGEVAAYLGGKMNGMKFRKMRASGLGDPAVEAGDCAIVTDRKGNSYHCYLTSVSYTTGSYETYETGAESPARNSSKRGEDSTTETVIARGEAEKVLSTYDKVVQQMTQLISAGFGMYLTPEKLDDGSTRYYMHDKPTKEESSYVCYLTSNGIMGSVDGGTTWAIDKNGNALYNVMTAIGVNAEWINAGKLVIRDKYGNETMFVDVETGAVRMVVDSFTLRGKTVEEIAIQANEEIINAVAGDLQAQVDGKIETYNQTSDPSTAWTTTAAKSAHKGDLWYSSNTKLTKRWTGTAWGTMAMEDAVAQDLAKSKRRIFVSTPVPPYDVGDLWVGNSASDMKRCQTARSSGSYYSSDWILATKYTDDTVANSAYNLADDALNAATTPAEYLTQADVFNKLTGNGAMQGIYMSGGNLYINATYIQGGILRLGGSNNGNGVLQVFDQYGTLKCKLDRVSLNINNGQIILNMDGSAIFKNGNFEGSVKANSGEIAGFAISDGVLTSASGYNTFEIHAEGAIKSKYTAPASNKALVIDDGQIRAFSGGEGSSTYASMVNGNISRYQNGLTRFISDAISTAINQTLYLPNAYNNAITSTEYLVFGSGSDAHGYSGKVNRKSSSSRRYKDIGKDVDADDIRGLLDLPVRYFKYKEGYLVDEDERNGVYMPGFIAEELEEILPIAVDHDEHGNPEKWNTDILLPCLLKMMQEQKKEFDAYREETGRRLERLEKLIGGMVDGNTD